MESSHAGETEGDVNRDKCVISPARTELFLDVTASSQGDILNHWSSSFIISRLHSLRKECLVRVLVQIIILRFDSSRALRIMGKEALWLRAFLWNSADYQLTDELQESKMGWFCRGRGACLTAHESLNGTLLSLGFQRCEFCQKPGATVGCCLTSCTSNYHFMCSRAKNCVFLDDKKVYCQRHRDLIKGEVREL